MTTPNALTFAELQAQLLAFREERDWAQFHTLKDLAAAIAVEAGELQELFLWAKDETRVIDERRGDVERELADVLILCLNFANAAAIDVDGALESKLAEDAAKYPVDRAHGRASKYTELWRS
jgi:dCTP diphosphatase